MDININFNKVAKFITKTILLIIFLATLATIYAAYILDQNKKIAHYNAMLVSCNKIPGSIVNFSASTPVFGTGVKMNCQYVNQDRKRL